MKTYVLFASLAAAALAAVPAAAHDRQACGHVPRRAAVHPAVYHRPVHRAPVRHLAARSVHSRLQYAAACGCGHGARARIAYAEPIYRRYRPRPVVFATYYEPRPIFYRPRMIAYREDFPVRRFHEHARFGGDYGRAYYGRRDREFDRWGGRAFEHRRFAMNEGWRR